MAELLGEFFDIFKNATSKQRGLLLTGVAFCLGSGFGAGSLLSNYRIESAQYDLKIALDAEERADTSLKRKTRLLEDTERELQRLRKSHQILENDSHRIPLLEKK